MQKPTKLEIITLISDYARKYHTSAISLGVEHEDAEISHAFIVSALDRLFDQPQDVSAAETKLPEARAKVFDAIGTERHYQELKWGPLEDHPQSVGAYLTLMRVHLADAEAAWARSSGDVMAIDRIRRVLAIGVACGEQHGMPRRLVPAPLPPATCDQISRTADILKGFETTFRQAAGDTYKDDEHE